MQKSEYACRGSTLAVLSCESNAKTCIEHVLVLVDALHIDIAVGVDFVYNGFQAQTL